MIIRCIVRCFLFILRWSFYDFYFVEKTDSFHFGHFIATPRVMVVVVAAFRSKCLDFRFLRFSSQLQLLGSHLSKFLICQIRSISLMLDSLFDCAMITFSFLQLILFIYN